MELKDTIVITSKKIYSKMMKNKLRCFIDKAPKTHLNN